MKTLILDDIPQEWFSWDAKAQGILKQAIPNLADLLSFRVGIRVRYSEREEYIRGNAHDQYQCQLDVRRLYGDNVNELLTDASLMDYDLYFVDCSIDGKDATEGGVDFAESLAFAFGKKDEQICIVTNKDNTSRIQDGTIGKFRRRFEAILKDSHQRIAEAIANRMCAPSRSSIPQTEKCNQAIQDEAPSSKTALYKFFHKPHPTRREAFEACRALIKETPGIPEPIIFKAAIEKWCADCSKTGDNDVIGNDLATYICTLNSLNPKSNPQLSDAIIRAIKDLNFPKPEKTLKDWLFPRVCIDKDAPFRKLADKLCNGTVTLNWTEALPSGFATSATHTSEKLYSSVPVSWFDVFDRQWFDGLKTAQISTLNVAVLETKTRIFRCVLFWNGGDGFADFDALKRHTPAAFLPAALFSHVFVVSKCKDESVQLVEVYPDEIGEPKARRIPSMRVCIDDTEFEFSGIAEGSAYLFIVPSLV